MKVIPLSSPVVGPMDPPKKGGTARWMFVAIWCGPKNTPKSLIWLEDEPINGKPKDWGLPLLGSSSNINVFTISNLKITVQFTLKSKKQLRTWLNKHHSKITYKNINKKYIAKSLNKNRSSPWPLPPPGAPLGRSISRSTRARRDSKGREGNKSWHRF